MGVVVNICPENVFFCSVKAIAHAKTFTDTGTIVDGLTWFDNLCMIFVYGTKSITEEYSVELQRL